MELSALNKQLRLTRVGFFLIHVSVFFVFVVGVSWTAVIICFATYVLRMFAIVGGYHRYFAHKAFKTSRVFQFILAVVGASAVQKGPLWWAVHHRYHHKYSDTENDVHSPILKGFWWAHIGWILSDQYKVTKLEDIEDFAKYPELVWLNRFHIIPPILLAFTLWGLGTLLQTYFGIATTGWQIVIWGFFVSTVFTSHCTFLVNSLTHILGKQRFETSDYSKNSFLISFLTLGEGWHNNHHRFQNSVRSGFYWWEMDITYYILRFLSWFGIVWDLNYPPKRVYKEPDGWLRTPADEFLITKAKLV